MTDHAIQDNQLGAMGRRKRKKYRESIAQRDQTYRAYLVDCRRDAEALANEQRRALLDPYPDPSECLCRAGAGMGRLSPHLWKRSSGLERPWTTSARPTARPVLVRETVRAMLLQLATHHAPNDGQSMRTDTPARRAGA
jgi:hypothetical protein